MIAEKDATGEASLCRVDDAPVRVPIGRAKLLLMLVPLILVGMIGVGAGRAIPNAIQIGGDEHFEVTKAFLWYRGYPLYERIWNDQPPLHTAILLGAFKLFGPSIGVARAVALLFALAFIIAALLVVGRSGIAVAVLSVLFMLMAPGTLPLALSAMLELPAIAIALVSLIPLSSTKTPHTKIRLAVAGILLALALQIKLTAIVLAPTAVVYILLAKEKLWPIDRATCRSLVISFAIWGLTAFALFMCIGWWAGENYGQAWFSHFSDDTSEAALAKSRTFQIKYLTIETFLLIAAGVGIITILMKRLWQTGLPPLALLLTVLVVHWFHRPFWGYYYLHFVLPLAWLSAIAIVHLYRFAWQSVDGLWAWPFKRALTALMASLLLSGLLTDGCLRTLDEIDRINHLPRLGSDQLLAEMRKYRAHTRWVFSQASIYQFHSGLNVIPELAVLPAKRFWSQEISQQEVWGRIQAYNPEQILLRFPPPAPMKNYMKTNYTLIHTEDSDRGPLRLFIAKRLLNENHENQ